jgi:hypothetical protein
MGFISSSGVHGPPFSCHDLYVWLLRVNPGFDLNDDDITKIVVSEEPDVELWQYMGRRFIPTDPPTPWVRKPPQTAEYAYPRHGRVRGGNSQIRAQFSFASQALRDRVVSRLTISGYRVTDTWRTPT